MPIGRKALRDRSKTSAGQYNINTEGLGDIPIPICDIKKQNKYAEKISEINRIRKIFVQHVDEVDQLFFSLQNRAFKGKL
jgi:type I restriction enzyme S subunit